LTAVPSSLGSKTTSQTATQIPIAVVDQGSATATPTASQSASYAKNVRSKRAAVDHAVIRQAFSVSRGPQHLEIAQSGKIFMLEACEMNSWARVR